MANFELWDRATLEQFAREATEKLVDDRAAIDELVWALKTVLAHWSADRFNQDDFNSARAALTKHTQRKEQK